MYAIVTRRRMNQARAGETRERAITEFIPKLQQAPGFVSFSLIQGGTGSNTAVILWESKTHADAFLEEAETWTRTLDEFGHQLETFEGGEVVQHVTART
jgi:heme-degrading monooxygenase HmoA